MSYEKDSVQRNNSRADEWSTFLCEKSVTQAKWLPWKDSQYRSQGVTQHEDTKTPARSSHDGNACQTYRKMCWNFRVKNGFAHGHNRVNEVGEDVEQLALLELQILDVWAQTETGWRRHSSAASENIRNYTPWDTHRTSTRIGVSQPEEHTCPTQPSGLRKLQRSYRAHRSWNSRHGWNGCERTVPLFVVKSRGLRCSFVMFVNSCGLWAVSRKCPQVYTFTISCWRNSRRRSTNWHAYSTAYTEWPFAI